MSLNLPSLDQINNFNRGTLIEFLDIKITAITEDSIEGSLPFSQKLTQPMGLVHGGVYCVVSESLASIGSNIITPDSEVALGQTITSYHLKPIKMGMITAKAKLEFKGRSSHLWNIEIFDEENNLVHVSKMQVAIREKR
ncbi:MAG: esterase [Bdellovibrio sp. CG12_big_fil_rev_8_21_14_0_65_39_13]|nr:MAG: esterase [Bdellovibrio sp. CG22_combo_CG10-13_8_21_14_all_39_27]PIQ60644.1 MAG: esterase [Bdellovibrio sp. CG12_big_fil_rev_8_21_14_0_65_39_13]PIR37028.1 MAG: esterase [Bdellovibrio sp. CG11_big_fil_rev_8_21_14_0_20_39_38]PJB52447.1 MAG: esterase [Bdellovibrio sp. CG_4_9_14_3_um_filter_39_7]